MSQWHQLDGNMRMLDAHRESRNEPAEGDKCPLCGEGRLEFQAPEVCTCHLFAPCSDCETAPLCCPACGEIVE